MKARLAYQSHVPCRSSFKGSLQGWVKIQSAPTKTGDRKQAEQIAALWEASAIRELVLRGTKPVMLHAVIKAFLAERAGKGGAPNTEGHLRHFMALSNVRMSEIALEQLQEVVDKLHELVAHNTLIVTVS